ncbi:amidohydrolase family protein [Pelagicoccus albus]|uniref:Amidohydrolase family protein n=1 Tax=Pelagicoccus albus TaxID=415222 RepID=A0A7X1E9H9_9BACT|nr:amidohydrolase family protein [Pelagicoccus albus]MBC2607880.1 amidohydrolase family protein [Pelagicoccus albus]
MEKVLIKNLGYVISGDLEKRWGKCSEVAIESGKVAFVGSAGSCDASEFDFVVDAMGSTLAPGLIDSHVHIVFGDWTPRQNTIGWIESYLHGGITSMMSASEVHLPNRPKDAAGVKALALTAHRCYSCRSAGDQKIHAGSVILEPGLVAEDFAELRSQGVWLAKMGFGSFSENRDAAPLVKSAKDEGFVVMSHTGGVSIPGSRAITADDLLSLGVDVAGHVNGGTTALPEADLEKLICESNEMYFQISQAGNLRSALKVLEFAEREGKLNQVLMSSDTPTGTGVMPLGTLKSVVELCALGKLDPDHTWAMATGLNAKMLRQNTGEIAVGKEADLLIIDAPSGSAFEDAISAMKGGDLPGISGVLIDGLWRVGRSRNTPLARNLALIEKGG